MRVTDGSKVPWKNRGFVHKNYPGILPLTKSQLNLLKKFGINAPTNAHKLCKITRKAYSFVHETLEEFERRKIVSSTSVKSKKKTKERIYDLELEGIFWIIENVVMRRKNDKECNDLIIRMLKHYSSKLPLVFGKWSYFRDLGLEDLFFTRLWFLLGTHKESTYNKVTEQQITRYFYLFDFYNLNNFLKLDVKAWLLALKNDCEINTFVVKELECDRDLLKNDLTNIEDVLSFLQSNKKD